MSQAPQFALISGAWISMIALVWAWGWLWQKNNQLVKALLTTLFSLLIFGCESPPQTPVRANVGPAIANITPTISQDVARMLIGIIADTRIRPDVGALTTFAAANQWRPIPENMKGAYNTKVGYAGKVDGHMLMAGSDGTNDLVSIAMVDNFSPEEMREEFREVYAIIPRGDDTSNGQRMEIFSLSDQGETIGLLTVGYGVVKAIQGTGSISFMSIARARKELPHMTD